MEMTDAIGTDLSVWSHAAPSMPPSVLETIAAGYPCRLKWG
jgi:hypothetical protein